MGAEAEAQLLMGTWLQTCRYFNYTKGLDGLSVQLKTVKNLPATHKAWVRSLCREDPLEEGMATHSSILAWRISWTEEPGRLHSMGSQRVGHD